jgi:hypothetical protein
MDTDTTKLTIRVPRSDLEFAKAYAKSHGVTLTEMVDRYLRRLRDTPDLPSQMVAQITGLIPADINAEDEYRTHLLAKHTR